MKKPLFLSLLGLPVLFLGGCSLINNNDNGINTLNLEKVSQLELKLSGLLKQISSLKAENEELKETLSGSLGSIKTLQEENKTLEAYFDKYKKIIIEDKLNSKISVEINTQNSETNNSSTITATTSKKEIGYIKQVYIDANGNKKLEIDYVQKLGSDECGNFNAKVKSVDIPGIFCLVNENPKLRTFTISNDVDIIMQTLSHTSDGHFNNNQSISFGYFKQKFNDTTQYNDYPHNYNNHMKAIPYRITIENNIITKIEEQYIS